MSLNIPLLLKAFDWARDEDEKSVKDSQWKQVWWASGFDDSEITIGKWIAQEPAECGTSFCIAGFICNDAGDTFLREEGSGVDFVARSDDGKIEHIPLRAMDLLGISDDERAVEICDFMFDEENNLAGVRACMIELVEHYGYDWEMLS